MKARGMMLVEPWVLRVFGPVVGFSAMCLTGSGTWIASVEGLEA